MRYRDLTIEIGPPNRGRYAVSVTAPEGDCTGTFVVPGDLAQLSSRQIGAALFKSLFKGEVCRLYDRSLGPADRRTRMGLRIRFRFDITDPKLAAVAKLRWELLFDPLTNQFLSREQATPIIRHLISGHPNGPAGLKIPLKILLIAANPASLQRLDLEEERRAIKAACPRWRGFEIVPLEDATLNACLTALREQGPFQVLHFMGHGDLDDSGEECLLFQTEEGRVEPVRGPLFADLIGQFDSLRLIVLNACHTGGSAAQGRVLNGVATSLIGRGFPTVVGMWREIYDKSAVQFSEVFYRQLAAREPIEKAMIEARRAMVPPRDTPDDWAVPVLYRRVETYEARQPAPWWRYMILVLILAAVTVIVLRPKDSPPPKPLVIINSPRDLASVQPKEDVLGSTTIPGYYHYLLVRDPTSACWLQKDSPLPVDRTGKFFTTAILAGNPGDRFGIIVIALKEPIGTSWRVGSSSTCGLIPPAVARAEISVQIGISTTAE